MKKKIGIIVLVFMFQYTFCQAKYGEPEINPISVQRNFIDWSKYQNENIMLSSDFVAFDVDAKEISKEDFLNKLINENDIPIRMKSDSDKLFYKLFKIETTSDTSIKATIAQTAFEELENYKKEGQQFPEFKFTDLNGNIITNASMRGNIVVIKCWYIHCASCIKEFPAVNQLVEKYKDRKDIVFISLAEDTPEQLKAFLTKKPLSYSVIPNMKQYMNQTLQLNAFPTHFIINKEGFIAKVVPNVQSLEVALEIESKK